MACAHTETDNETYEMYKPMASVISSRCSVNTFIQFYVSHFNWSSLSVSVSVSLSVNTPLVVFGEANNRVFLMCYASLACVPTELLVLRKYHIVRVILMESVFF